MLHQPCYPNQPIPSARASISPSSIEPDDSASLARLAAEACDDRKAVDIRLIRVEEISSLADWFVICTGLSEVQVRAIGRSVEDRLEARGWAPSPAARGPGGGSLAADRLRRSDCPHPHARRSGSITTWSPSGAMGSSEAFMPSAQPSSDG